MSRILHISPYYDPSIGGLETFCKEISLRTAKLNHDVDIITQEVKGCKSFEERDGVKIHRIKPILGIYKARLMPNIRKNIRDINPDVIHIQGPAPGVAEFVTMAKNNSRIIMTLHNDLTGQNNIIYRTLSEAYRLFILPRVKAKLDKLILLSEAQKSNSKLFAGFPSNKISIIQNGVDLEKFSLGGKDKDEFKNDLGIKTKFLILFVGSMEPFHAYKGVEYLLNAIYRLKELDGIFYFVGEGALKPQYMKMAQDLAINNKVRFTGKLDNESLIKHYRAADIFVLPSVSTEAMPIVMLEAMACGTPVITTRIPGPMEMIREGFNGYLVNPRDPLDLAKTIQSTLLNQSVLLQMQKNSRKEAEDKYSWDNVLNQYLKEYFVG